MPSLERLERLLGKVHTPNPHQIGFDQMDSATTRSVIRCAQMRLIALESGYSISPEIHARLVELGFSEHPNPHNDFREWLIQQPKGKNDE